MEKLARNRDGIKAEKRIASLTGGLGAKLEQAD